MHSRLHFLHVSHVPLSVRHTTASPIHTALSSNIQLLGELAAVAKPLALPVENIHGDDYQDGEAGQYGGGVFECVFLADVFVDLDC